MSRRIDEETSADGTNEANQHKSVVRRKVNILDERSLNVFANKKIMGENRRW